MLENPTSFVTGYGWQAYENANFRYATHNRYLNLLYNLGLVGLFLFLLTAANMLKHLRHAIASADNETRPFLIAVIFGLSAVLVSMLTGDIFNPWIFIWAFCGVAMRIAAETVSKATPAVATELRSEIVRHKGPAWQGSMREVGAAKRQ
jgi:O-antigen ligase